MSVNVNVKYVQAGMIYCTGLRVIYSEYNISFISGQTSWLQLNRRVLEHNFSKKTGPLELKFHVRWV